MESTVTQVRVECTLEEETMNFLSNQTDRFGQQGTLGRLGHRRFEMSLMMKDWDYDIDVGRHEVVFKHKQSGVELRGRMSSYDIDYGW